MTSLRLATVNMLNNPSGFGKRAHALLAEVRTFQPDVIHMQEVPSLEEDRMLELFEEAGYVESYSASKNRHGSGFYYGNVTLSKLPILEAEDLTLEVHKAEKTPVAAGCVRVEKDGKDALLINVHLAWGLMAEWVRLRQVEEIAEYAWHDWLRRERPILMAGDFNTPAHSSTIRFLTGLQEGTHQNGTSWSDAWQIHGTPENEITSDPTSHWGQMTSRGKGLDPQRIPKRRIDYIMSFGWAYGTPGTLQSFTRFGDQPDKSGYTVSDHFGLCADVSL